MALLAGSVLLVLIVELLNSGIEAAVDRVSFELHDLSKRAKDMASAAVFLSLLLCAGIWWRRCGSGSELRHDARVLSRVRLLRLARRDAARPTPRRRAPSARAIGQRGWQLVYGGGRPA